MQKSIKKIYLAVLSAGLLICAVFLCLPPDRLARADVTIERKTSSVLGFTNTVELSEDLFDSDPGAEDFNMSGANYVMDWTFEFKDHTRQNLSAFVADKKTNWWGALAQNVFIYEFNLYATNGDGDGSTFTARPQASLLIVLTNNSEGKIYGYIAVKNYYGTGGFFDYRTNLIGHPQNPNIQLVQTGPIAGTKVSTDFTKEDIATNGRTFTGTKDDGTAFSQSFGGGYTVLYTLSLNNKQNLNWEVDGNGYPSIKLRTLVSSPFNQYVMESRYIENYLSWTGVFSDSYSMRYVITHSAVRSVAEEIQRIDDSETLLEDYFTESAVGYAEDVLTAANTTEITVKYLEEIPGTPFATAVYETVSVPVFHGSVSRNDVETALGKSFSDCLGSHPKFFELESDPDYGQVYVLKYLKHTWIKAITVDGAALSYFLDINDSFRGTYLPYVDEDVGILTQDPYEFVFSTLITRYPELSDVSFENLYGYFGLILVPESFSVNTALKEIFDVSTSEIGVVGTYETSVTLNTAQYNALMQKFNYGFYATLWGDLMTTLGFGESANARLYLIYSEPGTEKAVVGENGADNFEDDGSVFQKEYVEPVTDIVKDLWNGTKDFLSGISSNFKSILIGAVIIAVAGVVIYILIKRRK